MIFHIMEQKLVAEEFVHLLERLSFRLYGEDYLHKKTVTLNLKKARAY